MINREASTVPFLTSATLATTRIPANPSATNSSAAASAFNSRLAILLVGLGPFSSSDSMSAATAGCASVSSVAAGSDTTLPATGGLGSRGVAGSDIVSRAAVGSDRFSLATANSLVDQQVLHVM